MLGTHSVFGFKERFKQESQFIEVLDSYSSKYHKTNNCLYLLKYTKRAIHRFDPNGSKEISSSINLY